MLLDLSAAFDTVDHAMPFYYHVSNIMWASVEVPSVGLTLFLLTGPFQLGLMDLSLP